MFPEFGLGRISVVHRDHYVLFDENSSLIGKLTGKLLYSLFISTDFPAVGDWVLLSNVNYKENTCIIEKILSRNTVLLRRSSGNDNSNQLIASNIDLIFICMSLNLDFNKRRLERYISLVFESGAVPVVVLTKSDLCENLETFLSDLSDITIGIDIVVTSSIDENGLEELKKYITNEKTVALIGSSGVGKSSIINKLMGQKYLLTNGLRNDDKGRHTTTHRELFVLESGGILIDTPGMREIQFDSFETTISFNDIENIMLECRFNNCSHTNEPGCAIIDALENGTLDKKRYLNYQKLLRENSYLKNKSKNIEKEKIKKMFGSTKNMKNFLRNNKKRW